jgi:hypothetical protein
MPKLTFYPLGNADCCLINLQNDKRVLFDYAAMRDPKNEDDKRIDLPKELRDDLDKSSKKNYEVVAFTHLDYDHTQGADEFFYFDHADKYQSKDRIKIDTLWVPAAVIAESRNDLVVSSQVIQAEARHRLKKGYGLRVFSRPDALKAWLEGQGLTLESRKEFITDAGQISPEFSREKDGVEFFVHAPFGWRQDETTVIDRNGDSLVMQATFEVSTKTTRAFLGSDVEHTALSEIVTTTKNHKREERLYWDVMKLPHHCSYLTLGPDRDKEKTKPVENVKWLFETAGHRGCYIVSPSDPIPEKGTKEDKGVQPPHRQAANYYRDDVVSEKDGEFRVTMEYPNTDNPKPVEIEITMVGASLKKRLAVGAVAATTTSAPRAG